ncbi:MAG: pyridoxamine 5'-phosphate oxidase family protein [Acidimicrobiia bacterium]|nr:pyridoxamine 5'-phosphate oxidase family protein [Acidimicrobiia bacterium]
MRDLTSQRTNLLLDNEAVGRLGVVSDGDPYVTGCSFVHNDGTVYLRTAPGKRLSAIEAHPRVCLEVSTWEKTTGEWRSIVALGNARLVDDPETEAMAIRLLRDKYRRITRSRLEMPPDEPGEAGVVVAIEIDDMTARTSGTGLDDQMNPGRL